jgi:hypothetical protein
VEVYCDEGAANHIGPEPCVHAREIMNEASVGERIGQPLSRERIQTRMPTLFAGRKARRTAHVIAGARTIRRGWRTWHVRTLLAREPGDLAFRRWTRRPPRPASGR